MLNKIKFIVIFLGVVIFYFPAMVAGIPSTSTLNYSEESDISANSLYPSKDLLQLQSGGHSIGFTPEKIYIVGMGYSLVETFEGTQGVAPIKENDKQVSYPNLWPGVNLSYETRESGIAESIYTLEPGADVSKIRLRYNNPVTLSKDGSLQFSHPTNGGYFTMTPPKAWQDMGERTVKVSVHFIQHTDKSVGFQVGSYDTTRPLIIDPVYQWHTFYGDEYNDDAHSIAIDRNGNVYVTGESQQSWDVSSNGTTHLAKNNHSGVDDLFVLKLDSEGMYQWHTFFGTNSSNDAGQGIAVDLSDNIYITGRSSNSWDVVIDSETKTPKRSFSGSSDIVVLKLNSNGDYQWHTFYGSADSDTGMDITIDNDGNSYITGQSNATWASTTAGLGITPKNAHGGGLDIFVLKLNSSGNYQWHTFYGSSASDNGAGITVSRSGYIYVVGTSYATWSSSTTGFGVLPKNGYSGNSDMVILKLGNSGNYQWHTFYGSSDDDDGWGIAVDNGDNAYITGYSYATWSSSATGLGLLPKNSHSGNADIAILKLNGNGNYKWHTFYGSSSWDSGYGIAVDKDANVYVAGRSLGSWNGPGGLIGPAPIHQHSGNSEIAIVSLDTTGDFRFHTFYGSSSSDYGEDIAVSKGNIFATGTSLTTWNGPGGNIFVPTLPLHGHSDLGDYDITVLKLAQPELLFSWHMFLPAIYHNTLQP